MFILLVTILFSKTFKHQYPPGPQSSCLNLLYYGLLTWVVFMLQILELIRTGLYVAGQSGR